MLLNIKTILIALGLLIVTGLGIGCYILNKNLQQTRAKYESEVVNRKAYEMENSGLKGKAIEFQLSIKDLKYSQDSLNRILYNNYKQLKIKDDKIKELGIIISKGFKKDTVYVRDTIFDEGFYLDTVVGNKYYNTRLTLEYPNKIVVAPSFTDTLTLAFSYETQTVDPPSKCFLIKLFQRKQEVTLVTVSHSNPYITDEKKRFIDIRKK